MSGFSGSANNADLNLSFHWKGIKKKKYNHVFFPLQNHTLKTKVNSSNYHNNLEFTGTPGVKQI